MTERDVSTEWSACEVIRAVDMGRAANKWCRWNVAGS